MGSVLGPIFSNFYISDFENKIFNSIKKPSIYLKYLDDILILANDITEIKVLDIFQKNSVLNFTIEQNKNKKIPFSDVLIDTNNNNNNDNNSNNNNNDFNTSIYKKKQPY